MCGCPPAPVEFLCLEVACEPATIHSRRVAWPGRQSDAQTRVCVSCAWCVCVCVLRVFLPMGCRGRWLVSSYVEALWSVELWGWGRTAACALGLHSLRSLAWSVQVGCARVVRVRM